MLCASRLVNALNVGKAVVVETAKRVRVRAVVGRWGRMVGVVFAGLDARLYVGHVGECFLRCWTVESSSRESKELFILHLHRSYYINPTINPTPSNFPIKTPYLTRSRFHIVLISHRAMAPETGAKRGIEPLCGSFLYAHLRASFVSICRCLGINLLIISTL